MGLEAEENNENNISTLIHINRGAGWIEQTEYIVGTF